MPTSFNQTRDKIEKKLNHAFRFGTSAFRLGLIPESISDHLPIVSLLPTHAEPIKMLSWNLLAEEHLFNNFMNISGTDVIKDAMSTQLVEGQNIYHAAMYHLFAELAQFIYANIPANENKIKIDSILLERFICNAAQPSRLAGSKNKETEKDKIKQVEKARSVFVKLCQLPNAHEYQLAIEHCMELIYHIKSPEGALGWKNRFFILKNNQAAVLELCSQDILAFQECTCPNDIEQLLNDNSEEKGSMAFISHHVGNSVSSTDNVVLAYNKNKFSLVDSVTPLNPSNPLKTGFNNKKRGYA